MDWVQMPLAQTSYQPRSPGVSVERLRNLYLEVNPTSQRSPASLLSTPGLKQWASVGTGPVKAAEPMGGYLWVVSGSQLWRVDNLGASDLIGDVDGTGQVRMAHNATHVIIAAGGAAQAADATGVIDLGITPVCGVTYQDGLGIFALAGSQRVYCTNVDNMTVINPLNFSTIDAQVDELVGVLSDHRELWCFKDETIEVWVNVGQQGFPFVRSSGGFVEHGCAAPCAYCKAENVVYWLADDLNVYRAAGYQAEVVSSAAIRNMISSAGSTTTCVMFSYDQAGHKWIVLLFSGLCLCYDITTGLWSERKSRDMTRWRPSCHASYVGKELVGDYSTGAIWELDLATYAEGTEMLEREIITPCQWGGTNWIRYNGIRLDCEMGQGLVVGQGSDPVALLSWSDDGGRTWCDERSATLGKIGEYKLVAQWNRLGRSRARSFRFRVTDPIPVSAFGAYASVEVMQ